MDAIQATLLITGLILCLIPLGWVQDTFFRKNVPVTVWTLLVPFVGVAMMGTALLSYHKDSLRTIFQEVIHTIDQTGLGIDLITNLLGGGLGRLRPDGFVALSGTRGTSSNAV